MSEPGTPPASLDAAYRRSPRMVARRIGPEYVLVPIARNVAEVDSLYTLNRLGAFLWERFDGGSDGHAHVRAIVERFEVDPPRATEDYLAFAGQLLAAGALEAGPEGLRGEPLKGGGGSR